MDRIQFDGVSKRYMLGHQRTAREALMAGMGRLARRERARPTDFWSLRNVSFTVADGEALGIVGRNGAGKSTILKIITRITSPTRGESRTRGRVAALLEVGTGFHPELTGRENIYLNGAILGMTRRDIGRAFEAIADFAGVEDFLDTPVKRYSSGMHLRLGFSVAAHLEPDVLVVDEVLAVGDAEFQRKCLGRMEEVEQEGRAVVFVSHDLNSLTRLCTRALWLDAGHVRRDGDPDEVTREYLNSSLASAHGSFAVVQAGPVTVHDVRVASPVHPAGDALLRSDPLRVRVDFELSDHVSDFDLAIYVTTSRGVRVLDEALSDREPARLLPGRYVAEMAVPPVLNVGDFTVGLWCGTTTAGFLDESAVASFTLHGGDHGRPARAVVLDLPIEITPA